MPGSVIIYQHKPAFIRGRTSISLSTSLPWRALLQSARVSTPCSQLQSLAIENAEAFGECGTHGIVELAVSLTNNAENVAEEGIDMNH
jgi:hypothetical protein